jgi:hypothetical protein
MPRKVVNLRTLSPWLQYSIALAVVAVVVGLAWLVGRDTPMPAWVTDVLVPALGWLYLIFFVFALFQRLRRR